MFRLTRIALGALFVALWIAMLNLQPASATAAQTNGGWRAEYYNNTSLSGGAEATRQDGPVLAFAWPEAPMAGVNADYFSVRWTMTLESAGGSYQFNTRHDDGARLYIDGVLVQDTWWDQMPTSYSVSRTLSAGTHALEYDYYHTYAGAVAQLEIVAAGAPTSIATSTPTSQPSATATPAVGILDVTATTTVTLPGNEPLAALGWVGSYYNNTSLSGGAEATRQDGPVLAFAWPGAPMAGVNADYFSVRWTMTLESAGGSYQFNTRHDDGARLYIDGELVQDTWWDQMPTSYSVSRTLSAGTHALEYEYYHTYAGAVAQLEIVAAGAATATSTPVPVATSTPVPVATSTPTPTPTATSVAPTPTATAGAATNTPGPGATSTPTATATRTPTPVPATATRTATPVPATSTPTAVTGGRDKLLQPFASDSPWNMPLGTSLSLVAANLPKTFMSVDEEPIILAPGAPLRSGYENGDWPASCRTSGARALGQFPVPDGYVIPEPSGGFLPNYSGGVLLGDGRTIVEMQYGTRCAGTGPLTMGIQRDRHDIYGSGLGYGIGGHGGSGLSGVAGSLRVWEVNGDAPIRHALKLNISAKFLSKSNGGYRWPAVVADTGYNQPGNFMEYVGTNPSLRMGSLLVLPAGVNINTLGLQTPMAVRLAWTLQNYGAYIVDSGPQTWTPHNWVIEYGVQQAMETRWGYGVDGGPMNSDSLILMSLLQVVDNNGPTSVGGGGARVQPLLPAISN